MNLKLLCATALMTLVATGSLFAQQDDTRINGLLEHIKQLEGRIAELENTRREEPVSVTSTMASTRSGTLTSVAPQENSTDTSMLRWAK